MQVFNSFSEMFNASCLSASAYFGSRYVDEEPVRMNDGIADISEFLAIDNKTPDPKYSTRESGFDNSEGFDEQELLDVSEELGGKYWKLFSDLRNNINDIGKDLFGEKRFKPITTINMSALENGLNRIDKALNDLKVPTGTDVEFYKEFSVELREQAKELRANAVKKWNEFKGTFYNITGYPEDVQIIKEKLRYFERDLAKAKSPQECAEVFFSLLDAVLVYDEKSNMWFSNIKPNKEKLVEIKGKRDSGAEKDFIKFLESGKTLSEGDFDRLLKKIAKSKEQLGKLYFAFKDTEYGFGWSPEEHWQSSVLPAELVACSNILFANHFGKMFWQYFARAWQIKYQSADKLDELFAKYGDKVLNLFGSLNPEAYRAGSERIKKAFWAFITEAEPIVIIQHFANRSNSREHKYHYWDKGELDKEFVYPKDKAGDEVDRLLQLFKLFKDGKYKKFDVESIDK